MTSPASSMPVVAASEARIRPCSKGPGPRQPVHAVNAVGQRLCRRDDGIAKFEPEIRRGEVHQGAFLESSGKSTALREAISS